MATPSAELPSSISSTALRTFHSRTSSSTRQPPSTRREIVERIAKAGVSVLDTRRLPVFGEVSWWISHFEMACFSYTIPSAVITGSTISEDVIEQRNSDAMSPIRVDSRSRLLLAMVRRRGRTRLMRKDERGKRELGDCVALVFNYCGIYEV